MWLNKRLLSKAMVLSSNWGKTFSSISLAVTSVLVYAALLFTAASMAFGQIIQVPEGISPQQINDSDVVQFLNANRAMEGAPIPGLTTSEIPFFTFNTIASRDGNSYTGSIVGGSPFNSSTNNITTTVNVVIVPVVLNFKFSGGSTFIFSPTATDPGCLGGTNTALSLTKRSPLFKVAPFTMNGVNVGRVTYPDAFQRGEFRKKIGPQYHLAFSLTSLAAQRVNLTASFTSPANATVFQFPGQCGSNTGTTNIPGGLGVVNINTFDPIAQNLITKLGLNAAQFPLFVLYNAVMSEGNSTNLNNCCILGYHNSETGLVSNPGQTYGVAEFEGRDQTLFDGTADISVMTHEVAEWINDPSTVNPTPAWGHIGQQPGCQDNLEVGDPLSGTLFPSVMLGGFTYHLQEMAFYSWFFGAPSIGAGGLYSDNGTFTSDAGAACS